MYCDCSTGTVLTHGGTDGHNFANCYLLPRQVTFLLFGLFYFSPAYIFKCSLELLPTEKLSEILRFGVGINMGTNNGGGLGRTRQAAGFGKIVTWIFGQLQLL